MFIVGTEFHPRDPINNFPKFIVCHSHYIKTLILKSILVLLYSKQFPIRGCLLSLLSFSWMCVHDMSICIFIFLWCEFTHVCRFICVQVYMYTCTQTLNGLLLNPPSLAKLFCTIKLFRDFLSLPYYGLRLTEGCITTWCWVSEFCLYSCTRWTLLTEPSDNASFSSFSLIIQDSIEKNRYIH